LLAKDPADRFSSGAQLVSALSSQETGTPVASGTKSIAVLPFVNLSASPDDEYFADGITEEIINVLSQHKRLRVAARTSCFACKGTKDDPRAIADRLGVRTVLEGSVRKAGSRLRITAQLINASDGCHLWSERFDREMTDVFAIQDDIASAIGARLELSLLGGAEARASRPGPRHVEAYELLLRGRVLLAQRGPSIVPAAECFQQALAHDPELAEAHALLGDAQRLLWVYGMVPSVRGDSARARRGQSRALARSTAGRSIGDVGKHRRCVRLGLACEPGVEGASAGHRSVTRAYAGRIGISSTPTATVARRHHGSMHSRIWSGRRPLIH
jgi:serine/threonine-protein kinase